MKEKRVWFRIRIALYAFLIFFFANLAVSLFSDPFAGIYQAAEGLTGHNRDELFFKSGGYSPTFLGWRSEAELWSKEKKPEVFRIVSRKPLHMIPSWSLESFSREPKAEQDSDGNAEKPPGVERGP